MAERPQLKLINVDTGELIATDPADEREMVIDQLQADLKGKALAIGKLKRELRELRSVEPESETIREILLYCNERWGKRHEIAPGGVRWEKVRARLKDKLDGRDPWTPEELKLAADGALLDDWISGRDHKSPGYLDAKTVFRDEKIVQDLRDLAVGFNAKAGVALGDLLDVMDEMGSVGWKQLLQVCICEHRRLEHSRPDPNREGREGCLTPACPCEDFDLDFYDPFNVRTDPWLQRHFDFDPKGAT